MKRDWWVVPTRWLVVGVELTLIYLLLRATMTVVQAAVLTLFIGAGSFAVVIYFVEGGRPS